MKKLLFAFLKAAGITRLAAWLNRRRVAVLCYHSVTRRPNLVAADLHKQSLAYDLFLAQLDYLRRRYRVVSLSEYVAARREGRRLPDYSVVLTFDDGARDFLTLIAPVLKARALPATAFVITDMATARESVAPAGDDGAHVKDAPFHLSWSEIRALSETEGIEFGSHSCSHPAMTELSPAEIEREMAESRRLLAEQTGQDEFAFATPHGKSSELLRESARAAGYYCSLMTGQEGNDYETDLFGLGRIAIPSDESLSMFAARVAGLTPTLRRLRDALLPTAPATMRAPHASLPLMPRAERE
jgi:peptidoglycan/xylan/chitin deacetylase (PgdA/CDA1 family)